ncbi:hypothetical protein HanIR_Chr12g0589071 [Helianthus annuus]|nr:hypothetical protein HanIR_Chr12g0589071 [Helianthus annuus]
MKAYAIVLIVCGSVAAAVFLLCCLFNTGKKKKTKVPTTGPHPPLRADPDLELGKKTTERDERKVILVGAVATAAVIVSAGGDSGGGGGGCGGGGCGGGGCGGGCGG